MARQGEDEEDVSYDNPHNPVSKWNIWIGLPAGASLAELLQCLETLSKKCDAKPSNAKHVVEAFADLVQAPEAPARVSRSCGPVLCML
jgi:hypothetical protein